VVLSDETGGRSCLVSSGHAGDGYWCSSWRDIAVLSIYLVETLAEELIYSIDPLWCRIRLSDSKFLVVSFYC